MHNNNISLLFTNSFIYSLYIPIPAPPPVEERGRGTEEGHWMKPFLKLNCFIEDSTKPKHR